ncbi:MAG: hypothetical protein AAFO29_01805, partial [Actinomycetota bacterium]
FISADGQVVLRDRGLEGLTGRRESAEVIDQVVRSGINPIGWPSALLMRRADFEAVGGFDPRWLHPIDLDLWLRLLTRGSLFGIDRSQASFRISGDSVTARIRDSGAQHRQVLRNFANDAPWPVSRLALVRSNVRSRLEQVRLRLLFAAVNSRHGWARGLPAMVLERRRPAATEGDQNRSVSPGNEVGASAGGTQIAVGGDAGERSGQHSSA